MIGPNPLVLELKELRKCPQPLESQHPARIPRGAHIFTNNGPQNRVKTHSLILLFSGIKALIPKYAAATV